MLDALAVTDVLAVAALVLHGVVLALLLPFAGHRTLLLLLSRRDPPPPTQATLASQLEADPSPVEQQPATAAECRPAPRVTVQLPVFNESRVVERLIDAACRLSYPRDRLQVQVLDDSTDETTALAEGRARFWRRRGVDVTVLRRPARDGFKAGALAAGLERATGEFLLVLDADFLPRPDLLRRLLPPMADPGVGMVQARWDHLNEHDSWLTRAQALLLDGHFFFEQAGRCRGRRFFNFNGTAGLWRRQALEEAGGWQFDTLTEDLDVSYRAQMAGWRFAFLEEVGVAAELPRTAGALLVQQRRWAQGGVQTARKVLPRLLRGPFPAKVKLEAFVHLCGHLAHAPALALSLLIVPAAFARRALGLDGLWWVDGAVFLAAAGPFVTFYLAAARKRGRSWSASLRGVGCALALGAGLSLLLCRAALRGLRLRRDPFERTPKLGAAPPSPCDPGAGAFPGRGAARTAGAVMVAAAATALAAGFWASLPFLLLFASGHLALGGAPPGGLRGFRQQKRPHVARRRQGEASSSYLAICCTPTSSVSRTRTQSAPASRTNIRTGIDRVAVHASSSSKRSHSRPAWPGRRKLSTHTPPPLGTRTLEYAGKTDGSSSRSLSHRRWKAARQFGASRLRYWVRRLSRRRSMSSRVTFKSGPSHRSRRTVAPSHPRNSIS